LSRLINPHTGEPMSSTIEAEHRTMWVFDPEDDITNAELALVVRMLMQAIGVSLIKPAFEALPDPIKKHFSTVEFLVDGDGQMHPLPEVKNG